MTPLLLLPLLLSQTHSRWEAAVRTEVRARSALAQDTPGATAAGDLDFRPRLAGAVFNGPWSFDGSYTPTLWLREPYAAASRADHAHEVQLNGVWAKEGTARVFLSEYFIYGTLDLTTLNQTPGAAPVVPQRAPGLLPRFGRVRQLTTDTSFGVDWTLSRALSLLTSVGYTYGGGLNLSSQYDATTGEPLLPLQSSPRAQARLQWQSTTRDSLGLILGGRLISFQANPVCFEVPQPSTCLFDEVPGQPPRPRGGGTRVGLVELSGTWLHLLAPQTSFDLSAGVTGASGSNADGLAPVAVMPMAGVGISHRIQARANRVDLRLSGLLGPFVDRYQGTVYERLEGNGSVTWNNGQKLYTFVRAGASQSFTGIATTEVFTAYVEGGVGYLGDSWWRIDLAGREAAVQAGQGSPVNRPQNQWVVGLSATFTALSAPQPAATE